MEIIHLLRQWKSAWLQYRNQKKYAKVPALRQLLQQHPNLKSVAVERDGLIFELQDQVRFAWDTTHPTSYLLAIDEHYEALERKIIKKILQENDVVFDVGANFGYFSVLMKRFCPSIQLHSFEPVKNTYATLLQNLSHNQLTAVKTYNFGFSNENSEVVFYIPAQLGNAWASMGTGVSKVYNYRLRKEMAFVRRMDDFMQDAAIKSVDFIKCDVEGAEKLVIDGGMETIKRNYPTLMLEIGDMWTASFGYNREILIANIINDLKYKCFGIFIDQLVPIESPEDVRKYPEEQMYNYFFVHPSRPNVMSLLINT